jgi:hypothetical protein
MTTPLSPAIKFANCLYTNERNKRFLRWINELPEQWIEMFITQGLKFFLKSYGYSLGFTLKEQIKYFKVWAFNIVDNLDTDFIRWAHNGGHEEFEFYCDTISIDDWSAFMDIWQTTEFLDDSDAGLKQRNDIQLFVWHFISLENSPQYHKWLNDLIEEDQEDQYIEEGHAYSGDRRTY